MVNKRLRTEHAAVKPCFGGRRRTLRHHLNGIAAAAGLANSVRSGSCRAAFASGQLVMGQDYGRPFVDRRS